MDWSDFLRGALSFFLIVTGVGLAYLFYRLATVFMRLANSVREVTAEFTPILSKAQTTIDGVNLELARVDEIMVTAVNTTKGAERAVGTVSRAVTTPVRKASGLAAGAREGWTTFKARRRADRAAKREPAASLRPAPAPRSPVDPTPPPTSAPTPPAPDPTPPAPAYAPTPPEPAPTAAGTAPPTDAGPIPEDGSAGAGQSPAGAPMTDSAKSWADWRAQRRETAHGDAPTTDAGPTPAGAPMTDSAKSWADWRSQRRETAHGDAPITAAGPTPGTAPPTESGSVPAGTPGA